MNNVASFGLEIVCRAILIVDHDHVIYRDRGIWILNLSFTIDLTPNKIVTF